MSINSFNKGLDDAYFGTYNEKMMNNIDYLEGLSIGEDIERRYDQKEKEEQMEKEYWEEYEKQMEEEYKKKIKKGDD